jgi:hypothetical protein
MKKQKLGTQKALKMAQDEGKRLSLLNTDSIKCGKFIN